MHRRTTIKVKLLPLLLWASPSTQVTRLPILPSFFGRKFRKGRENINSFVANCLAWHCIVQKRQTTVTWRIYLPMASNSSYRANYIDYSHCITCFTLLSVVYFFPAACHQLAWKQFLLYPLSRPWERSATIFYCIFKLLVGKSWLKFVVEFLWLFHTTVPRLQFLVYKCQIPFPILKLLVSCASVSSKTKCLSVFVILNIKI